MEIIRSYLKGKTLRRQCGAGAAARDEESIPKEAFYLPVGYCCCRGAAMNKGLDGKALCSIVAEMTQRLIENELSDCRQTDL
ncbi:MAG: hypothetical protein ACLRXQ_12730 [Phascolarctobacterium faecium]